MTSLLARSTFPRSEPAELLPYKILDARISGPKSSLFKLTSTFCSSVNALVLGLFSSGLLHPVDRDLAITTIP